MGYPTKLGVLVLAGCTLGLLSGGCRSTRRGGKDAPDRDAQKLAAQQTGPQRIASREDADAYEREARLSSSPREGAENHLQAAAIYVDLRLYNDAKRALYAIIGLQPSGPTARRAHRLLGETYLATREVVLAERYLLKGLSKRPTPRGRNRRGAKRRNRRESKGRAHQERERTERDRTLARLVLCARARDDEEAAERYQRQLTRPFSPEVNDLLAQKIVAAFPRHRSSRVRTVPPAPTARSRQSPPRSENNRNRTRALSVPRVLDRSRWRARHVKGNTTRMTKIHKITIHHTGDEESFWGRTEWAVAHQLRKQQSYHQNKNGWADIGYHFIVDRSGRIWQGRKLDYQGAHARHENPGNIGIALLGNYNRRQRLTPEQRRNLADFVVWLSRRYSISPQHVYTHREILGGKTSCPGPEIGLFVAQVRDRLRSREMLVYKGR